MVARRLHYPRRRRFRRIRRRRMVRRFRRRRLAIRRPAGTYYCVRRTTQSVLSITAPSSSSKPWSMGYYTTTLSEWNTNAAFDYYKILKMKLVFLPIKLGPGTQQSVAHGTTAIDLDGAWSTTGDFAQDALRDSSTRRFFTSLRKHSRYFTPKPQLVGTGSSHPGQSLFFVRQRDMWLNTYDTAVKWGGLLYSIYRNAEQSFMVQKSVWILFRSVL